LWNLLCPRKEPSPAFALLPGYAAQLIFFQRDIWERSCLESVPQEPWPVPLLRCSWSVVHSFGKTWRLHGSARHSENRPFRAAPRSDRKRSN